MIRDFGVGVAAGANRLQHTSGNSITLACIAIAVDYLVGCRGTFRTPAIKGSAVGERKSAAEP
jgi:hypothetical protein